jgi:hypothetical protein
VSANNKDKIKDVMKNPKKKKTPLTAFLEDAELPKETEEPEEIEEIKEEVNPKEGFWNMIEREKKKRKTIEDYYTRQTYLIRNDLLERFENIAKDQPWGFKRRAINYAIEKFLDEVEHKKMHTDK